MRWRACCIALLAGALALAAAAEVRTIASAAARFQPDQGAAAGPHVEPLPHRWDSDYPHSGGRASYRLELPPKAADAPHALFFTRVGNQVEVRLNGQALGALGTLGDPATDYAKGPVWMDVPAALLNAHAPNVLDIAVTTQANRWGGLEPVRFGPAGELRPLYASNYRWRQLASVVIVLSLALMALMAGGLWWRQRDLLYGLLALAALFGVLRMGDRLLVQPPLPWPLWGAVTASAFVIHLMLMARLALHAVGEHGAWIRTGFWIVVAGGVAAAWVSFFARQPQLWTAALGALCLPGLAVLACGVRSALRTRSRQSLILCAAGFVVILTGFRDWLFVRVAEAEPTFSLLPHAVFVFVLLMGWIVVDRYSQQVLQYRELNESLEKRIAQREAELGASYAQLAEKAREQALLQERQRIMRDIHDGVGAHLVSLLNLAQRGNVAPDALQSEVGIALDELRVAVDSLQPVHGDLTTVLATLRYRLQPRLEAAGLAVAWDVGELPPLATLTPQTVLQVQRVLLEAFTNVLRHARASRIEVSARASEDPPALVLEVVDDGVGWAATDAPRHGVGLRSMRTRSEAIGAALHVSSAPGAGTRVRLELPRA